MVTKKELLLETEPTVSEKDPTIDAVFSDPKVHSYTTIEYAMPEHEGRELKPGHKILFMIPQEFQGRIVRDVILRHRKGEKYVKDIGPNKRDPYGAYSLVELHDQFQEKWIGWKDPKGYNPIKFAEPRSAGDPENEVLHDWIATVGIVQPDSVRVTNTGAHPEYSTSQIHGLEVVFFPELYSVIYDERVYTPGTTFIDIDQNKLLPTFGGGSMTEGVYAGAIVLNKLREPLYETGTDPGPDARIEERSLVLKLQPGILAQVEVSIGDTEHLSEVSPKTNKKTRLGYAKLWVGIKKAESGQVEWFIKNANVPPQGVLSGGPLPELSSIAMGDELIIESRSDTAYLMGYRLTYKTGDTKTESLT